MTINITTENIYLITILFLAVMQIYQWRVIYKIKSEIDSIWNQIHVLTVNIAAEIIKLKKIPDDGEKSI